MIKPIYDAEAIEFVDNAETIALIANFVGHNVAVNYAAEPVLVIEGMEFREGDYVVKFYGGIAKADKESVRMSEGGCTDNSGCEILMGN